jgi:hypothetical protein
MALLRAFWWLACTAFIGANLLQSTITRGYLLEAILRKRGTRKGCRARPDGESGNTVTSTLA